MDPATITVLATGAKAFESIWQIGGVVAVLMAMIVILLGVAILLAVRAFKHISGRLGQVEDSRVDLLVTCITDTKSSIDAQTAVIRQQTDTMRGRPCLVSTDQYHRPHLPQTHP
jgi:hypothetical protein